MCPPAYSCISPVGARTEKVVAGRIPGGGSHAQVAGALGRWDAQRAATAMDRNDPAEGTLGDKFFPGFVLSICQRARAGAHVISARPRLVVGLSSSRELPHWHAIPFFTRSSLLTPSPRAHMLLPFPPFSLSFPRCMRRFPPKGVRSEGKALKEGDRPPFFGLWVGNVHPSLVQEGVVWQQRAHAHTHVRLVHFVTCKNARMGSRITVS
jgi:hypothetical protein